MADRPSGQIDFEPRPLALRSLAAPVFVVPRFMPRFLRRTGIHFVEKRFKVADNAKRAGNDLARLIFYVKRDLTFPLHDHACDEGRLLCVRSK